MREPKLRLPARNFRNRFLFFSTRTRLPTLVPRARLRVACEQASDNRVRKAVFTSFNVTGEAVAERRVAGHGDDQVVPSPEVFEREPLLNLLRAVDQPTERSTRVD